MGLFELNQQRLILLKTKKYFEQNHVKFKKLTYNHLLTLILKCQKR